MGVSANSAPKNVDRLAYERKVVESFVGGFGWRTLLNALWPVAGWAMTLALYTNDSIPLIAAIALCAVFIQALYMPVHESVHRTISAGRSRYACGSIVQSGRLQLGCCAQVLLSTATLTSFITPTQTMRKTLTFSTPKVLQRSLPVASYSAPLPTLFYP